MVGVSEMIDMSKRTCDKYSILCLTGSGLGDTCMAMPAIKHLSQRYSGLRIVLACANPLVANVAPWVDAVVDTGKTRCTPLHMMKMVRVIRDIRYFKPYHLAVSFTFHPIRQAYLMASGADHLLWTGDGLGYRGDVNNQLVNSTEHYDWYPPRQREDYVCIHPFTRQLQGHWDYWQRLIYDLGRISPVYLVGNSKKNVYSMCAKDLVNKTLLAEIFEIIARARLVVTADTGIMHIAIATNTPCVALFGRTAASLRIPKQGWVIPCYIPCESAEYFHRAGRKSHSNLPKIPYEEVLKKCQSILRASQPS